MATFVLVHGAWSGGWVWNPMRPYLQHPGHDVYPVTLTGLGDRVHLATPSVGFETHVQDVVNFLWYEDLTDVVLVGWSYGVSVVAAVAHRVPERLGHLVCIDSRLPEHEKSIADVRGDAYRTTMERHAQDGGDGWLLPPPRHAMPHLVSDPDLRAWYVARMTPHPWKTYIDPIQLDNPAAATIPKTMLLFMADNEDAMKSKMRLREDIQADPQWRLREMEVNHFGVVTKPREVAQVLRETMDLQAAGRVPGGSRTGGHGLVGDYAD